MKKLLSITFILVVLLSGGFANEASARAHTDADMIERAGMTREEVKASYRDHIMGFLNWRNNVYGIEDEYWSLEEGIDANIAAFNEALDSGSIDVSYDEVGLIFPFRPIPYPEITDRIIFRPAKTRTQTTWLNAPIQAMLAIVNEPTAQELAEANIAGDTISPQTVAGMRQDRMLIMSLKSPLTLQVQRVARNYGYGYEEVRELVKEVVLEQGESILLEAYRAEGIMEIQVAAYWNGYTLTYPIFYNGRSGTVPIEYIDINPYVNSELY